MRETMIGNFDIFEYRSDHGHVAWAWKCVKCGLLSLNHDGEAGAEAWAVRHVCLPGHTQTPTLTYSPVT